MSYKFCPMCGEKLIKETFKFCPECGFRFDSENKSKPNDTEIKFEEKRVIDDENKIKECPKCNRLLNKVAEECPYCGYNFNETKSEEKSTFDLEKDTYDTTNDLSDLEKKYVENEVNDASNEVTKAVAQAIVSDLFSRSKK